MGYVIATVILKDGRHYPRAVVTGGIIGSVDGESIIPFSEDEIAELVPVSRIVLSTWIRRFGPLLPVSCGSISGTIGLLLADVSTSLRVAVPSLAFEVIDAARQVEPHHRIPRAMLLRFLLGREDGRPLKGIRCNRSDQ
jgi:hypothetical protein